jgi:hypothetical protein
MKHITRLICLAGVVTLAACGGAAEHAHDEDGAAHAHDGGEMHSHDGDHMHEAPATEAFYGDAAADEDAAAAETLHSHDDGEPHTHDH